MPKLSFVHLFSRLSDNYSILVPSFFLEKTFGQIFKGLKVRAGDLENQLREEAS